MRSNDAYAWTQHYNVDRAYGVNGLNQIMTAGLTTLGYDGRGNLTSSNGQAYGYNADNMMTSAPNGTTMAWDPLGRLAQTVGAGVTTRFAYDGINLIAEYEASNTLLRRYVHGPGTDDPIVWYEGSGTTDRRFLMADERGSIVSVTDSVGATLRINTYDEYGIPAAANLGRFQYTGQTWLPEAGLYHYKARMYSPTLGRFMQTDPIGYADGMNWYAYVGGDPVNFRDPLGENSEPFPDDNDHLPELCMIGGLDTPCKWTGDGESYGVDDEEPSSPDIVVTARRRLNGGGPPRLRNSLPDNELSGFRNLAQILRTAPLAIIQSILTGHGPEIHPQISANSLVASSSADPNTQRQDIRIVNSNVSLNSVWIRLTANAESVTTSSSGATTAHFRNAHVTRYNSSTGQGPSLHYNLMGRVLKFRFRN